MLDTSSNTLSIPIPILWIVSLALVILLAHSLWILVNRYLRRRALRGESLKREQAQAEASNYSQNLNELLDHAHDGMLIINLDGRIVTANLATQRLLGLHLDQFVGRLAEEIPQIRIEGANNLPAIWSRVVQGENSLMMASFSLGDDATLTPIEVAFSQVTWNGQPAVLGIVRDVTERQKLEEARRAENEARLKLAARDALLARLAAHINTSLDLQTTLDAVVTETAAAFKVDLAVFRLYHPESHSYVPTAVSVKQIDNWKLLPTFPENSIRGRFEKVGEDVYFARGLQAMASDVLDLAPRDYWDCAYLFALLSHNGQPVGSLNVVSSRPEQTFNQDDFSLLGAIRDQVAIAISNARLYEEVVTSKRDLEGLSRRLVDLQETERRFIARELHDETGQLLTQLNMILERVDLERPAEAGQSIAHALNLVHALITQVRSLSLKLRPSILDDLGLVPALLWHIDRFTNSSGIAVDFRRTAGVDRRFPVEVETAVFRAVQEALTNIARYARVKQASVFLWFSGDRIGLQVEDRGVGFNLDKVMAQPGSLGLNGMRERAELLGGSLAIETCPGQGTLITLDIPCEEEEKNP